MTDDWKDDEDIKGAVNVLVNIYAIVSIFLCGWIVSLIWNWHIAPLGLPLISKRTAIGIATLWGVIGGRVWHRERTPKEHLYIVFNSLLTYFWCLGIAWIAQVTK